ncbi:MAG: M48 family metallopeptidase [Gammaproteobacteria bacterium]
MITIKGYYYDGRCSAQTPVSVSFADSGVVSIIGDNLSLTANVHLLTITARLGNTRRSLFMPNGAKLETDDNDAVDSICRQFSKHRWQATLHRVEQRWLTVLSAVVISILFIWSIIEFGIPLAAEWAAKGVPQHLEVQLGKQTLANLDKWLFDDSNIDTAKQAQLTQHFQRFTANANNDHRYRLLLRDSKKMGANALALPGGTIVMTDALLRLAENDDQLLAVLAHEMGHIEYQHGLRSLLQNSFTAILMIGLVGDISSISSLSATLPTLLVESRYSRQFEQEADLYAVSLLREQQIDTEQFVRILSLLEQTHHSDTEFDYLSSHPAMSKRLGIIKSLPNN